MSNLFKTLELEAFRAGITPRSQESRDWFRKKAQQMRRVNRNALMKEEPVRLANKQLIGSMQMFFYDPKGKKELPYYDTFPLVIVIGPATKGFMGLNLHYLPPLLRAKMLDGLLDITSNQKYDDNTRFELSYTLLKRAAKYKYFKPCIKHYLTSHVRSRFATVPAPEWEIAAFLPTADFQGASAGKVYADSRKKI
jgi:hypothetical protein